MSTRGWALSTAITGAAVLAVSVAFSLLPEVRDAGQCMGRGAVIQFEFARNTEDLTNIFGPADSICRDLVIAAMDAVNVVDLLAFIPAYVAFCMCAALYLSGGQWGRPLAAAAVASAVLAGLADVLETSTLLEITGALDAPGELLASSQLGAWSKFALLAAHALFCAGLCLVAEKRRWILGVVLLAPTLGVAAAASDHVTRSGIMGLTFVVAWVALLGFAIRDAVRARGASA